MALKSHVGYKPTNSSLCLHDSNASQTSDAIVEPSLLESLIIQETLDKMKVKSPRKKSSFAVLKGNTPMSIANTINSRTFKRVRKLPSNCIVNK